jgi:hypothetical protein
LTYAPHPGHGAIFKNGNKTKPNHPDYKGALCLPDGSTVQIGGWITEGKTGKYLSLKCQNVLPPQQDPDAP